MRKLVGFWVLSLILVALAASFVTAQVLRAPARIVTDLGFRITGTDPSGRPVGNLMIRENGQWVEISRAGTVAPLEAKY
jgi:hypothetical protein